MSGSLFPDIPRRKGRPNIEAPLAVWEYAFALERRADRYAEALALIADIDPITDKHAPVQMRNAQRLAKDALGV